MPFLILGRYESLGLLGQGSMGAVYAARPQSDLTATVVVKTIRADRLTGRSRDLFEHEIRTCTRIQHPYIVRIIESGTDEQLGPCIVMEFVAGRSLSDVLKAEGVLDCERAVFLLGCLCHGLDAAHRTAVIHRDLKPANIMVVNERTRTEYAKIMDFGLAASFDRPHFSKERLSGVGLGAIQGTPSHMSPEQIRGETVDGRTDIYALGVTAFEMLTGRKPFDYPQVPQMLHAHLTESPPRFASLGIDLPHALETVIRDCLAKYAPDRPESARVLASTLGRSLGFDLWEAVLPPGVDDDLPVAEQVDDIPDADPEGMLTFREQAWMPDAVAVIKIGGFLNDQGGQVVHTEPGLLRARFVPPAKASLIQRLIGTKSAEGDGVQLDIRFHRPDPAGKLHLVAQFRPLNDRLISEKRWQDRSRGIFEELRKYLMAH